MRQQTPSTTQSPHRMLADWVNPFCTRFVRPGALPFDFGDGQQAVNYWLHRFNLIVGPHGCGKTTLLRSVIGDNAGVTWIQLRNRRDAWFKIPGLLTARRRIVIDGYESCDTILRVLLMTWCRISGRSVLATSHRRIRGHHVVYECHWDVDLARRLVIRLLSQSPPQVRDGVLPQLDDLLARQRDENFRDLFFDLYDVVQDQIKTQASSHRAIAS